MLSPARRLVAVAALLGAVIGLGSAHPAGTPPTATGAKAGGDALTSTPRPGPAPLDAVTAGAPLRAADVSQGGRTRVRWIGDLLVALALVALWAGPALTWWTGVEAPFGHERAGRRPASGRAPPVALIDS